MSGSAEDKPFQAVLRFSLREAPDTRHKTLDTGGLDGDAVRQVGHSVELMAGEGGHEPGRMDRGEKIDKTIAEVPSLLGVLPARQVDQVKLPSESLFTDLSDHVLVRDRFGDVGEHDCRRRGWPRVIAPPTACALRAVPGLHLACTVVPREQQVFSGRT
eukprot:CAMPEP_0175186748 /NCGR_PEP_ID=MMETSP0093-20121207/2551_1 /TAXON_ID=311494 /ORGANISM="Alexandrium monilatum, Strain CCMP3105" /LENGTH=158 /DNA_ID=CAMNT_0016479479 /DNA_START=142 /DNA_END=614 /DNA_ORIENTATION=-